MKILFLAFIVLFSCAIIMIGCTSSATLSRTQTSNTYTNKLGLKAAVYLPPDFTDREIVVSPSTQTCSMWKAKINSGNGYYTAIESGLSAALQSVDVVKIVPTPEMAKTGNYDLLVTVNLSNENASVSVNEGFLTNTLNSQFQVSFSLTFADKNGQSLYSYTANGSGFNNVSGSCSDIAESAKKSMETALKQVADYVSQSTYGSAQLSEYAKHPK
jgi:Tfp pilus assembly protein PilX